MDLMSLVKELSQQAVAGNTAIQTDKKELAAETMSASIIDGLKNQVSQGNVSDLFDIFSKKETASTNTAMNGIQSSTISSLSQKLGIGEGSTGSIASLIPTVLGLLGKKASNPNDSSLDFNSLFQMIGGGKLGGVDANSAMNRLDDDNDGFGLDDITSLLSGNNGGNGIMGALGNIFGGK